MPDFSKMTPEASYKGAISIPDFCRWRIMMRAANVILTTMKIPRIRAAFTANAVDIGPTDDAYTVGYTVAGNGWNTVNVAKDGPVDFKASAAAGLDGASFRLFLDDQPVTDTVKVPNGGDWTTYSEVAGTATGLNERRAHSETADHRRLREP